MRPTHIKALAQAVAHNFMVAGFGKDDLLTGQIMRTDIAWQNPPLETAELLGGFAFSDYIDTPGKVDPAALYMFWVRGLDALFASPASVCTHDGWRGLSPVMPAAGAGERALRFAVPEDFPKHHPLSGHVFTLEVVHLFVTGTNAASALVSDESNYRIETKYGPVGIEDGRVIGNASWEESASGLVDTLLLSPRGYLNTTCRFDLLAKVRSVLHENLDMFEEYLGMDYALQALAKLSQERFCKELLSAIEGMLPESFETKRRIKIIDEAIEMLELWTVNDRVKLGALYEILVPTVFSSGQFYSKLHNISKPMPSVLSDKTLTKIRTNLLAKRKALLQNVSARERPALERNEE